MRVVTSPARMLRLSESWRRRGLCVGFVPTMGALHEGHLSLIRRARRENDRVVVSIFVNPLQFGPREDYSRYPRPSGRDRRLCARARVDALYRPTPAGMYPPGFRSHVEVEGLSGVLCGAFRPGHFRGVATVVLKLFEQTRPDRAYFGEKDFQQLVIIRRMAADLGLPVKVVGCPTVRERDGLALSSRNAYLDAQERASAPSIHKALRHGVSLARHRKATPAAVIGAVRREVARIPGSRIDYIALVDEGTLQPARRLRGRLRLLTAVRLGPTRLIDNLPLRMRR